MPIARIPSSCYHFCVLLHKSPYLRTLPVRYYTMSSGPSRPGSPPIPDLDDWSGSESGGLASKQVETTRGVETQGSGSASAERAGPVDPAHDVKNEAADNVKMGRTASEDTPRNSVMITYMNLI